VPGTVSRLRAAHCELRKGGRRALVALVALPCATGCFVYRGVPTSALRSGDVAVVSLRPPAESALAPFVGPNAARIDGRVLAAQDSLLTLAVTSVARGSSLMPESWPGDPVRLPFRAVDVAQVRRLDARRSVLLAGLGVLAALGVRAAIDEGALGRGKGVPPGGTK